ncbi:MAG: hypothetical protein ABIH34_03955 [Nanoarchaeota archaeon]
MKEEECFVAINGGRRRQGEGIVQMTSKGLGEGAGLLRKSGEAWRKNHYPTPNDFQKKKRVELKQDDDIIACTNPS